MRLTLKSVFKFSAIFCLWALFLTSLLAQAGGRRATTLEPFVSAVAKKTGTPRKQVRFEMMRALRASNRYSDQDIARVTSGRSSELSQAEISQMIHVVQQSKRFRVNTGLTAIYTAGAAKTAGEAFERLANDDEQGLALRKRASELKYAQTMLEIALLKRDKFAEAALGNRVDLNALSTYKEAADEAVRATLHYKRAVTELLTELEIPFIEDARSGGVLRISYNEATRTLRKKLFSKVKFKPIAKHKPSLMIDFHRKQPLEASSYSKRRNVMTIGSDFLLTLAR